MSVRYHNNIYVPDVHNIWIRSVSNPWWLRIFPLHFVRWNFYTRTHMYVNTIYVWPNLLYNSILMLTVHIQLIRLQVIIKIRCFYIFPCILQWRKSDQIYSKDMWILSISFIFLSSLYHLVLQPLSSSSTKFLLIWCVIIIIFLRLISSIIHRCKFFFLFFQKCQYLVFKFQ